jgi:nucleotide-binding universal stress UspA family protein
MFSTIVVGTDGSDSASEAVVLAAGLARSDGSVVHLVTVHRETSGGLSVPIAGVAAADSGVTSALVAERSQEILDQAAALLEGVTVERHAESGNVADVLIAIAAEINADLIVVGNKGMDRRIFGSVPNSVAHSAPCSVLVVKTT